jgi:S1-C subfamily serine protease
VHSPQTTIASFGLLITIVGGSFWFISMNPVEVPREPGIGIEADNITPEIAQALGLGEQRGVLIIAVVPGGPADRAGLRGTEVTSNGQVTALGDIIIAADSQEIRDDTDLRAFLSSKNAGDNVRLTIIRGGTTVMDVNLTLGERSS